MLKYNVYIENPNARKIETYNIFDYPDLEHKFKELKKKHKNDKETFLKEIEHELMYRFWSKCEWEITLSSWPPSKKFNDEKIDVYQQIKQNWHIFSEYVWENL